MNKKLPLIARRVVDWLEWLVALVLSAALGVSYGFTYGTDNQLVYLLGALQANHPGVLERDWFASEVTHYHPVYGWLGSLLLWLNEDGWGIAIGLTVTVCLGGLCLYWTLRKVCPAHTALAAYLAFLGIVHFTRTDSAGSTYLFDRIYQPSTVASLGLVAAVVPFVQGRYWLSGILAALGGLFHANLLILSLPAFALAHLLLGTDGLLRRAVQQFVPPLVAVLLFVPTILATATDPNAAAAQEIYFYIRAPHHFDVDRFWMRFLPLVSWTLLAAAFGGEPNASLRVRRLHALGSGAAGFVGFMVMVVMVFDLRSARMLFPWRLAPFAEVLLQVAVCAGALRVAWDPRRVVGDLPVRGGLLLVGLSGLCLYYVRGPTQVHETVLWPLSWLLLWIGLSAVGAIALRSLPRIRLGMRRYARASRFGWVGVVTLSLLGAWLSQTPLSEELIESRSTLFDSRSDATTDLFRWMREESPREARFLTPPTLDAARFHGQRAIVVDFKAVPVVPSEIMEWHERISAVAGKKNLRSYQELKGYHNLNAKQLAALTERYDIDYVVVHNNRRSRYPRYPVEYRNSGYTVLRVEETPAARR